MTPFLADVDSFSLLCLSALLRTASVTEAARQLSISQPNLSRTLARLRVAFADPLLLVRGRRMELTPFARSLAPRLEHAMLSLRQLFEPAAESARPADEQRLVRIAASDYASVVVVEPWLARLRREAPGVTLRLHPATPESIGPLSRGELDLAIAPRVPLEGIDELVFRRVLTDRLVVCFRKKHPVLHGKKRLSLATYLACEHVTVASERSNVSAVQLALHAQQKTRKVVVTMPTFLAALSLVEHSDLVAGLPERLVRGTNLLALPLPLDIDPLALHVAWHPHRTVDPFHRWLRESLLTSS